jgi:hypothetical protein
MDALKFENADLELHVRCSGLNAAFKKARAKQSDIECATSYSIPDGNFLLVDFATNSLAASPTFNTHPIFFENKDYFFGIRFKDKSAIDSPSIYSRLREIQDKFYYESDLGYISGTLNFGNDIGKSDLILRFNKNQLLHELVFSFEVFPTKLDYRNDHNKIVRDIEEEYPHLVLDFLKKTYSSFELGQSNSTDVIWWQVFGRLYAQMISSANFILSRPRSKLVQNHIRLRADRIKKWTNRNEESFAERRLLPGAKYTIERSVLTSDTIENQFFKHVMFKTATRYKRIKSVIERKYSKDISQEFRDELNIIEKDLERISANPFFKTISEFKGLRQESLVLQKATGYSNIYRSWLLLNRGLKFFDGMQRIELKNIAELYQIWCFLEIKSVLQSILGKERPDEVKIAEIRVDNFVFHIEEGVTSRIAFVLDNDDRVELFHEFSFNKTKNAEVRSYTVNQRPDIVLKITKNDLREKYALTYLYDAKYRLLSDDDPNSPDLPPEDAINQMHRYRDAIYYVNRIENKPEKEVIGAYVLFPGRGKLSDIREAGYYKSISDVNIGALPLVPNDPSNRELLVNHFISILGLDTEGALGTVAPQKMSTYEAPNPEVLIGIVRDIPHAYCYLVRDEPIYYTGPRKPNYFGYKNLRYFAPYLIGQGVSEYFEILGYEVVPRDKIFNVDEPLHVSGDKSERLVLKLGKRFQISSTNESFKLADSTIRHFRYTKLAHLRNPRDGRIEMLTVSNKAKN